MLTSRLVAAAIAASLFAAAPALAQTGKPVPSCGLTVDDPLGDNTSLVPTQVRPRPAALDIERTFFDHTDDSTTINIQVANLTLDIPLTTTGMVWTTEWTGEDGVTRFVRAVLDITGNVAYEHGARVPPTETPVGGVLPRYEYRGGTTGRMFLGQSGVVQIDIPATLGGAAGSVLSGISTGASESRQAVPNAVTTPTRGLSFPADRAPNGTATSKWTVAACAAT